jgi:hypothetical protein
MRRIKYLKKYNEKFFKQTKRGKKHLEVTDWTKILEDKI